MRHTTGKITALLEKYQSGEAAALDDLMALVYEELRLIARKQLRARPSGMTLSPTAVVNEAFLALRKSEGFPIESRRHFFAIAAQCMRWVISDHARAKKVAKRGPGRHVTYDEELAVAPHGKDELADLDEALEKMRKHDPELARLVELRFLLGLSIEEVAHATSLSPSTVKRRWLVAKAWLARELDGKKDAA